MASQHRNCCANHDMGNGHACMGTGHGQHAWCSCRCRQKGYFWMLFHRTEQFGSYGQPGLEAASMGQLLNSASVSFVQNGSNYY